MEFLKNARTFGDCSWIEVWQNSSELLVFDIKRDLFHLNSNQQDRNHQIKRFTFCQVLPLVLETNLSWHSTKFINFNLDHQLKSLK